MKYIMIRTLVRKVFKAPSYPFPRPAIAARVQLRRQCFGERPPSPSFPILLPRPAPPLPPVCHPCLPPSSLYLPLCTVSTPSCLKPLESSLIYETHKRFDSQPLRCFPNLWNLLWGAGSSDLDINSDERRSAHSQCPRSVYIS